MKKAPGWRLNMLAFAAIILFTGSYFFWQTGQAAREFRSHSREHSRALAAIVALNIRNTLLAGKGLEETVASSLKNSARFLAFLESTEPFTSAELTAFSTESGLAGVKIIHRSADESVSGPIGWLAARTCGETPGLVRLKENDLYLFTYFYSGQKGDPENGNCVLVGISSRKIDTILERISVERLLMMLNNFHDIAYVRLESPPEGGETAGNEPSVEEIEGVLETVIPIEGQRVVIALKADRFTRRIHQMKKEFFIFITILVFFGAVSSWWLYRLQRERIRQARRFERELARQHEDAALGRAAATITHELRNPLNAIGMGLQRLQLESAPLDREHRELIVGMREALNRTDAIISRLRQYVHSFEVTTVPVDLARLVERLLLLYRPQCEERGIKVSCSFDGGFTVAGDRALLGELFENLLKNSIEAQQHGGYINIRGLRTGKHCRLELSNGGFCLTRKESSLLFEPYFTSKSKGTGLGLVISKKIIEAHGGKLDWNIDFDRSEICFVVQLPSAELKSGTGEKEDVDTDC
ncbi:sensor histidine kinase [Desulfomarina sp.]